MSVVKNIFQKSFKKPTEPTKEARLYDMMTAFYEHDEKALKLWNEWCVCGQQLEEDVKKFSEKNEPVKVLDLGLKLLSTYDLPENNSAFKQNLRKQELESLLPAIDFCMEMYTKEIVPFMEKARKAKAFTEGAEHENTVRNLKKSSINIIIEYNTLKQKFDESDEMGLFNKVTTAFRNSQSRTSVQTPNFDALEKSVLKFEKALSGTRYSKNVTEKHNTTEKHTEKEHTDSPFC